MSEAAPQPMSEEKMISTLDSFSSHLDETAASIEELAAGSTDDSLTEARRRINAARADIENARAQAATASEGERRTLLRAVLKSVNVDNSTIGILKIDTLKVARASFKEA